MPSVALASCSALPEGDADERLLPPALEACGIGVRFAIWNDPEVDWEAFDLVVVRATWDYTFHRDAFLDWADRVPRLLNPPGVLRWNSDKRYLDDLAAAGIPVVPTAFVEPAGPRPPLSGEVVVKPAVSAGARDTGRFPPDRHREAHAAITALQAEGRVAMIQPYLRSVDERGETGALYLGGAYSHTIHKGPILRLQAPPRGGEHPIPGLYAPENIAPREPTAAERDLADTVSSYVHERFGELLYERIDLVEDDDGAPRVLEVELTEPSLFLGTAAGAPERFAKAIEDALGR